MLSNLEMFNSSKPSKVIFFSSSYRPFNATFRSSGSIDLHLATQPTNIDQQTDMRGHKDTFNNYVLVNIFCQRPVHFTLYRPVHCTLLYRPVQLLAKDGELVLQFGEVLDVGFAPLLTVLNKIQLKEKIKQVFRQEQVSAISRPFRKVFQTFHSTDQQRTEKKITIPTVTTRLDGDLQMRSTVKDSGDMTP